MLDTVNVVTSKLLVIKFQPRNDDCYNLKPVKWKLSKSQFTNEKSYKCNIECANIQNCLIG